MEETKPTVWSRSNSWLERCTQKVTAWTGSALALLLAVLLVVAWALTGPIFHYSDTWQLVINTGTTIITFLMVFIIQRSQNKDTLAIHLKLNEIVAALKGASNQLIDIESLSEEEVRALQERYHKLAEKYQRLGATTASHSIEEMEKADNCPPNGAAKKA
jgi:low affinity Fe/Cu permease